MGGGDVPRQGPGNGHDVGMVLVMRGGWGATRALGLGRCVVVLVLCVEFSIKCNLFIFLLI